ncbi:MAG: hypothetical protein IJE93_10395 [Clostridia bacterium]|nr:hypothetical protein [Clostridia bacterium]
MKRMLTAEVVLLSPSGRTLAPVQIIYDDDEELFVLKSEFSLIYNGAEYKGVGADYLWTDTFADLQTKLPKDVKLACCMTCRHGNMCPYGNKENLLFCTQNLKIASKQELCDVLFEDYEIYEKHAVTSFDYCDNFIYQSDDFYTYNDYLYQLRKKENR